MGGYKTSKDAKNVKNLPAKNLVKSEQKDLELNRR